MKTLTISGVFFIFVVGSSFGQSEKLQSGDSVRVELERSTITKELIEFRDSINQTLYIVESRIQKAKTPKKEKLEQAKKELIQFQGRIKLDLEEVAITSQNGWNRDSMKRIRANTETTRREYKRVLSTMRKV